jgi:two-component system KDP operon response regulator KdpE
MSTWRLLIADDDPVIRRALEAGFLADGFDVTMAHDGTSALQKAEQLWPDAVILDLIMPNVTGYEVAAHLRGILEIPIIMLTSVNDEQTMISSLEGYADASVCKPFRYSELRAQLNHLLARYYNDRLHPGKRVVVDECLSIDFTSRLVWLDRHEVVLTPIEARILFVLLQNPNKTVPTKTLLRRAWRLGKEGDLASLWVRMRQLRAKMEPDPKRPRYIFTERGAGYRFNWP